MITRTHVWHLFPPAGESASTHWFLMLYSFRLILEHNGFTVEPLSEDSRGVSVRHTNAHAMNMLILKNQIPKGITVEAVV